MTNILDPSAVLGLLPSLLQDQKRLSSPQDGLALLSHGIMTTLAFRLIAVDDESPAQNFENNVLHSDWNKHGPGHYTLRYRHDQSSLEFLLKFSKLGGRTLISAIAAEVSHTSVYENRNCILCVHQTDKASSLDIATNDFMSPSFFPYDVGSPDAPPLVHGFISSNRVADYISQFRLQIVQKLLPSLRKDGYTEIAADTAAAATSSASSSRPRPENPPPARPRTPPFSPEQPFHLPSHIPPENPLQIGRRDLDPILGGRSPFGPPPVFPPDAGDGMYVGPDHPMFRGGGQGVRGIGGGRGLWGGDGYLPPMGAPPGARFDPVGPNLGPFPQRGGFGGPRGPPGMGNLREPDNDEFMPPGAVSISSTASPQLLISLPAERYVHVRY